MTRTDQIMALADEISRPLGWSGKLGAQRTALRAEVQKLEDECERLRKGGCARDQGLTQYCAEAAGLAQEVERLRQDAKRYQWLRDGGADNSSIGVYEWRGADGRQRRIWLARDELDAAIDAAIAQEKT